MAIPTKWGTELTVNAGAATATPDSRVIALADGRFMIVWGSNVQSDGATGWDVRAQIYGADGLPQGASFTLTSNPQGSQILPDITELTSGKFAASWTEVGGLSPDQSSWATRASIINANGTVSGMYNVPTTTNEGQLDARITALPDGGFVVTWQDHSGALDPTRAIDIRAQIFNSNGSKRGGELLVNTGTDGQQMTPAITTLANGNFVVAWWDQKPRADDPSSTSVRAQIYSPTGVKIGVEFLLNTVTTNAQAFPDLTPLDNGGFFVAYADQSGTLGDFSVGAVNGQFFAADGTAVGAAFRINTKTDGAQTLPTATQLADGRLVVTWVDYTQEGSGWNHDVRGQLVNPDGTLSGEEFLISTSSAGQQDAPTVAALGDGRFVVSWTDDLVTNDNAANVHAQVFDPRTAAISLVGGNKGETWYGTAFNDTMKGGKGNDVHRGGAGNDSLIGDQGNDSLYGETGNDNLSGGSGNDLLIGEAGNDKISGGAGNDRILGGLGRDDMNGGKGNDVFVFASAAEISSGNQIDRISDFEHGLDDIDLSAFMQNGSFIGAAAFSGQAGQVHYEATTGMLTGDVNGDGTADWQLQLSNKPVLTANDFIF